MFTYYYQLFYVSNKYANRRSAKPEPWNYINWPSFHASLGQHPWSASGLYFTSQLTDTLQRKHSVPLTCWPELNFEPIAYLRTISRLRIIYLDLIIMMDNIKVLIHFCLICKHLNFCSNSCSTVVWVLASWFGIWKVLGLIPAGCFLLLFSRWIYITKWKVLYQVV